MSDAHQTLPPQHPEEQTARVDLRFGRAVSLQATLRTTPAGLVSIGVLVSGILLSTAVLVWAAVTSSRTGRFFPRR